MRERRRMRAGSGESLEEKRVKHGSDKATGSQEEEMAESGACGFCEKRVGSVDVFSWNAEGGEVYEGSIA